MQTLIKWPGGKTSEYEIIKKYIPNHNRYIEPFFGGGAVFFSMPPQQSIINDISENLMSFYDYLKTQNAKFKDCLYCINSDWEKLKEIALEKSRILKNEFEKTRTTILSKTAIFNLISKCCSEVAYSISNDSKIIINADKLENELLRMVTDKVLRTRKNELKNNVDLSSEDLVNNILTGFTSGYYMYLRSVLNLSEKTASLYISNEYKIAVFYFIREFCYGSMFRYSKNGDFNIPYGGIAYNNKDFRKKLNVLFSNKTREYLSKSDIYCRDFESVLDMAHPDDFVFLDPPYDTDFSDYENRVFCETDQRRLAMRLRNLKAKFLLIIKNTPLINSLYQNSEFRIHAFDNKYKYCVKGRNDRNAVHLIITNYDL